MLLRSTRFALSLRLLLLRLGLLTRRLSLLRLRTLRLGLLLPLLLRFSSRLRGGLPRGLLTWRFLTLRLLTRRRLRSGLTRLFLALLRSRGRTLRSRGCLLRLFLLWLGRGVALLLIRSRLLAIVVLAGILPGLRRGRLVGCRGGLLRFVLTGLVRLLRILLLIRTPQFIALRR